METKKIDIEAIKDANIKGLIIGVAQSLEARGFDAYKQFTGYLITGDLAYITSYNDARNKIQQVSRYELLETILKEYVVL